MPMSDWAGGAGVACCGSKAGEWLGKRDEKLV